MNFKCALLLTGLIWSGGIWAADNGEQLRSVVIVSRHGVRSPTVPVEDLAQYSDQAWPKWNVAPGMLTPHGRDLMVLMGKYYGARYRADGLLGGSPQPAGEMVYACSDEVPRTTATAKALVEGLLGTPPTHVDVLARDYSVASAAGTGKKSTRIDSALSDAAVRSRYANNLPDLVKAYRTQFQDLASILGGKSDWFDASAPSGKSGARPKVTGAIGVASTLVEDLVLEYTEGMETVGWGRMTRAKLTDCYLLHALEFDLAYRTPYLAQVNGSNLANRVLRSLDQAATGQAVPGAFGPVGTQIAIVAAHDGNVAHLASLLGASWTSDGLPLSPTLPGGALVFELWQHDDDHHFAVRAYYIAQTLDQMRNAQPLDLRSPPSVATLMLPGGTTGTDNEAPLPKFEKEWAKALDSRFIIN